MQLLKTAKNPRLIISGTLLFTAGLPTVVFAQIRDAGDFVTAVSSLISTLIPITASIALLAFFYGLVKYIFAAGNEEGREAGKRTMIAGVISLFLIAAIGGIIEFISQALEIDTGGEITPPTILSKGGDGIG